MSPSSEEKWDNDWMPYFRPSKTEGTTERIFDAVEFHSKDLRLKFPSVDWSETRLVAKGDPEWGVEYLSPPQLLPALPCLSASSAVPMTAAELESHLNREEAQPAQTADIDPRRNRHLFVDCDGNKWIRAGVAYAQELPPAYLKFEDQDGAGRFYAKTVRIESRMTVACTEDKARIVTRSDFDRQELEGQRAQVEGSIRRLNLEASEGQLGRLDQEIIEGSRDKLQQTPKEAPRRSSRRLSVAGQVSVRALDPALTRTLRVASTTSVQHPVASTSAVTLDQDVPLPDSTFVLPQVATRAPIASTSATTLHMDVDILPTPTRAPLQPTPSPTVFSTSAYTSEIVRGKFYFTAFDVSTRSLGCSDRAFGRTLLLDESPFRTSASPSASFHDSDNGLFVEAKGGEKHGVQLDGHSPARAGSIVKP